MLGSVRVLAVLQNPSFPYFWAHAHLASNYISQPPPQLEVTTILKFRIMGCERKRCVQLLCHLQLRKASPCWILAHHCPSQLEMMTTGEALEAICWGWQIHPGFMEQTCPSSLNQPGCPLRKKLVFYLSHYLEGFFVIPQLLYWRQMRLETKTELFHS